MLNDKPQFWSVNISKNKTIIFNNMQNSLYLSKLKKQTTAEETRTLLKRREKFLVLKLKRLYLDGLNQELNNID